MHAVDEALTVRLSPEIARLVRESVGAGEYTSADEAVQAAVLEWSIGRDMLAGWTPEELNRLIDEGIASGPGRDLDVDDILREAFARAGIPHAGA